MKNRRSFLKHSSIAIGATSILGNATRAQNDSTTENASASAVTGYDYRLPKFETGTRLLFQGDSITDMKWGRNQSDRNHYLGHSYVYLIASRLGVDMPQARLDFYNRGISGNKVGDLKNRWQKDAIDMKPDLLSILVGVNDVGRNLDGVNIEQWESDYRSLLDQSRTANPDLRVVLLDPFVVPSGRLADPEAFKKWRTQVERLNPIVERLAKDYQAVHIRTQEIFDAASKAVSPEQWIWDGVHPLPQGHELIARNWIEAVNEHWK